MAQQMPQFPLQMVAFPGERVPLHVFEPRYRQLVEDCRQHGWTFGIPAVLDGRLQEVGTQMALVKIGKVYKDVRMDILAEAKDRYQILEFTEKPADRPYAMALVEAWTDDAPGDPALAARLQGLVAELRTIMRIKKRSLPAEVSPYTLGHKVGFDLPQEYHLLQLRSLAERQTYVIEQLQKVIPKVREMEELRKRIEMNGHFRHIVPPKL